MTAPAEGKFPQRPSFRRLPQLKRARPWPAGRGGARTKAAERNRRSRTTRTRSRACSLPPRKGVSWRQARNRGVPASRRPARPAVKRTRSARETPSYPPPRDRGSTFAEKKSRARGGQRVPFAWRAARRPSGLVTQSSTSRGLGSAPGRKGQPHRRRRPRASPKPKPVLDWFAGTIPCRNKEFGDSNRRAGVERERRPRGWARLLHRGRDEKYFASRRGPRGSPMERPREARPRVRARRSVVRELSGKMDLGVVNPREACSPRSSRRSTR